MRNQQQRRAAAYLHEGHMAPREQHHRQGMQPQGVIGGPDGAQVLGNCK